MVILKDIPQGSLQWIMERLWRLTASEFKKVLTPKGKLSQSKTSIDYVYGLISSFGIDREELQELSGEMDDWEFKKWLSHYTGDSFAGNIHTQRGHEYEHEAIATLSERYEIDIQPIDMVVMGDCASGVVSCSPDGAIFEGGRMIAGGEVKNPCRKVYLQHVRSEVLPSDYELQVHGSMAVCDVDRWYFGSKFKNDPLFSQVVERSELTDTIQQGLLDFREFYAAEFKDSAEKLEKLRNA